VIQVKMCLIGLYWDNRKTKNEKRWCMKNPRTLLLIGFLVCLGAYLTPNAKAGEWDREAVLTFSQPVEIPGKVLPAGTYVFSFVGSTADRNLIEVLSQDEQKVYATIEAIPDYRAHATGESSIVFEARKPGVPLAIKEWFFPDRRYGHEFVYPEAGIPLELGESDAPHVTMERSGQTTQPEETDYLRLLHQKQTGALESTEADESGNGPSQSAGLSYLQALHQKQTEALKQFQIPAQDRTPAQWPVVESLAAFAVQ